MRSLIIIYFIAAGSFLFAQQQTSKWYFGLRAGLDFSSSSPVALMNSAMDVGEGCASIADNLGNLLFYTSGDTVWNAQHSPMVNGSGLFGDLTPNQSSIIIKKPNSANLYYLFTVQGVGGPLGFRYNVIDMQLAAGLGSVTVKNVPLYPGSCTEGLTATRHCNGTDYWIVIHEDSSMNFRSYLLTSAGISTTAIISPVGPYSRFEGLKISPNGKKLALGDIYPANIFQLFDFDNSSGIISNPLTLLTTGDYPCTVEFSPDCSKLYGGDLTYIYQWNLCAGSNSAILGSINTITPSSQTYAGTLQLANNGKIYVAWPNKKYIGVINDPNLPGVACNFVDVSLSIAPKVCGFGLPNFESSVFKFLGYPKFTYTISDDPVSCQTTSFTGVSTLNTCSSSGSSIASYIWDFGDPGSGNQNNSSTINPTHSYKIPGQYLVKLKLTNTCGGVDTLKQTVNIPLSSFAPTITVTGKTNICKGENEILNLAGANQYKWNGASLAGSTVAISPSLNTTYTVIGSTSNSCAAVTEVSVVISECSGMVQNQKLGDLRIFPNPTSDFLTLRLTSMPPKEINLILTDISGRILQTFYANGNEDRHLDVSGFESGVYFLQLQEGNGVFIYKRFVISR
jgi:PKD repeat protein